jgi:HEAT repeats
MCGYEAHLEELSPRALAAVQRTALTIMLALIGSSSATRGAAGDRRKRMNKETREIHERLVDRLRAEQARAPKSAEWRQLEVELEANAIDPRDLGIFSSVVPTTFDYEAAAPILVGWLPRVRDPIEKEVLARSLTGVKTARSEAARAIVTEFRNADMDAEAEKWAYGNALATLADAEIADDLLELVRDGRHGRARQMLCDALKRTKDPRAPDALIELIDDDDIAGHAISALRSYGPKSALPHLERARPKLEAVLTRPTASPLAKRQSQKALERLAASP